MAGDSWKSGRGADSRDNKKGVTCQSLFSSPLPSVTVGNLRHLPFLFIPPKHLISPPLLCLPRLLFHPLLQVPLWAFSSCLWLPPLFIINTGKENLFDTLVVHTCVFLWACQVIFFLCFPSTPYKSFCVLHPPPHLVVRVVNLLIYETLLCNSRFVSQVIRTSWLSRKITIANNSSVSVIFMAICLIRLR